MTDFGDFIGARRSHANPIGRLEGVLRESRTSPDETGPRGGAEKEDIGLTDLRKDLRILMWVSAVISNVAFLSSEGVHGTTRGELVLAGGNPGALPERGRRAAGSRALCSSTGTDRGKEINLKARNASPVKLVEAMGGRAASCGSGIPSSRGKSRDTSESVIKPVPAPPVGEAVLQVFRVHVQLLVQLEDAGANRV